MGFYMGSNDAAKIAWMTTFSAVFTAAPTTYGFVAGDAVAVAASVALAVTAFNEGGSTSRVPNDPNTYSPTAVAARIAQIRATQVLLASYAMQIRNDNGISDPNKVAIGVNPINNTRTPINVPGAAPLINVLAATSGVHTLAFADAGAPTSRGKPFGALQLQSWVSIGTVVAPTPVAALFYGVATKTPFPVAFDSGDAGKIATHFARWVGRRGDVSSWSSGAPMTVAF